MRTTTSPGMCTSPQAQTPHTSSKVSSGRIYLDSRRLPLRRRKRCKMKPSPSGRASGLTHHFSQRFQGSEPVQSTSTRFSTPPGGGDGGCSFLYFFSRPGADRTLPCADRKGSPHYSLPNVV